MTCLQEGAVGWGPQYLVSKDVELAHTHMLFKRAVYYTCIKYPVQILPELAVIKFRIGILDRYVDFIILFYISIVYLRVYEILS